MSKERGLRFFGSFGAAGGHAMMAGGGVVKRLATEPAWGEEGAVTKPCSLSPLAPRCPSTIMASAPVHNSTVAASFAVRSATSFIGVAASSMASWNLSSAAATRSTDTGDSG
uniref:Uncharacterized protein n=1 Tax=Arundo donax TaxID=35708 RepID=A0A0A9BWB9_ARUDO